MMKSMTSLQLKVFDAKMNQGDCALGVNWYITNPAGTIRFALENKDSYKGDPHMYIPMDGVWMPISRCPELIKRLDYARNVLMGVLPWYERQQYSFRFVDYYDNEGKVNERFS